MGQTVITDDGRFEWDADKNAKNIERHNIDFNFAKRWYKSSERARYPHPKKLRVECSLDEDVVRWLETRTREDEEFPIYINHYLRKIMDFGLDRKL